MRSLLTARPPGSDKNRLPEARASTAGRRHLDGSRVELVRGALREPGAPLDRGTNEWMSARFGHDFSRVRVHTDTRAAESASALDARAYTVGRDVIFGAGQYAPQTPGGRHLLAHELAHVVQPAGAEASPDTL